MSRRSEQESLATISLLVMAAVAATAALIYTRSVMVPFVLAVLFSYLILPLVDWLQLRLRLPRWLALVATLLVVLCGLLVVGSLIVSSIGGLEQNASLYRDRVLRLVQQVQTWLHARGLEVGQVDLVKELRSLPVLSWVQATAGSITGILADAFLILLITIYLVAGRTPKQRSHGFMAIVEHKIHRYIVTKVGTSLTTGVLVGLILWMLGLDLALVFGLLAFLLNFIPSVGSIVATLLPLPVAVMQFDSALRIAAVLGLPLIVQMVIGNAIEPKLMGRGLDLHSITVLLMLIFWGLVWGIPGMLMATPITAILKVVFEAFETTRPVAELLAGRLQGQVTEVGGET